MARPFIWTPAKEAVMRWRCETHMSQAEQAARLGVTRRTVEGWIRRKAFQERYSAYAAERLAAWEAERRADLEARAARMRAESEAAAAADLARLKAKYGRWWPT